MKTALWEILYWEKEFEPLIIFILGNVFLLVKVQICPYFNKENSSLIKSVLLIYFTVTI
jgi:hypothetical protein